jgi:hypothetical protein
MLLNHLGLVTRNERTAESITVRILSTPVLAGARVGIYQPKLAVIGEPAGPGDDRGVGSKIAPNYVEFVLCLLMVFNYAELIRMLVWPIVRGHRRAVRVYSGGRDL